MKKADFKLANVLTNNAVNNEQRRAVPLQKGDVLHFELSDNLIVSRTEEMGDDDNKRIVNWYDIVSTSGATVSSSQIARRNNGLNLAGNTIADVMQSFINLFNEDGTLSLKVSDVIERQGTGFTSRYLKFALA